MWKTYHRSIKPPINESIDRFDQSIDNQSVKRSIDQSIINQSVNQSIYRSIDRSINQFFILSTLKWNIVTFDSLYLHARWSGVEWVHGLFFLPLVLGKM